MLTMGFNLGKCVVKAEDAVQAKKRTRVAARVDRFFEKIQRSAQIILAGLLC